MADAQQNGFLETIGSAIAGAVAGGGLIKFADWWAGRKDKADDRVDKAKAEHIAAMVDRINDTETRLDEVTAAHRDCEEIHAMLAGRVGALEAQASECFEDRKVLRQELAEIRKGKQ